MKKILLILILAAAVFPVFSQALDEPPEEQDRIVPVYDLGDQAFGLNIGTIIPLFATFPYRDPPTYALAQFYKFPLGVLGSIEWNGYINNNMTLGFNIAGMFAITWNNTHSMVPITFSYKYIIDFFPFYMPLSIEAGIIINSVIDSTNFGPVLKPGISFYYRSSSEWDFGGNIKYWWVPELWIGTDSLEDQTSFGNFLEISFSAIYHF